MGNGFQRGMWVSGSHGDPDPDVPLPAVAADALLDGQLALVPWEFRPLADTVAALCGPPSEAELGGEARARAAYRSLRSGTLPDPAPSSRTLPLELRAASPPRRSGRARHRSTRPSGRRGTGGRLGLASGVAAVIIAVAAGLAYAGGAFPSHVKSPSSAAPSSSARPSASASGGASVAGMSAAHAPRATPSPSPAATGTASGETPQALCEAWLKDPWRPSSKTWDREDFDQLSTLAGSPQLVLFYCWTQLPMSYWRTVPLPHFPSHSDNGHWAWPAGGKPAPGDGSSQGGNWGPGGGAQGGGNSQANKASGASTSASIGNASTGNRTARP